MKKIINKPEEVVRDMIEGMGLANPNIRVLPGTNVIVRKDAPVAGKVGVISGGGSGHEPAHGGLVGKGMLDGACAGDVFTSPSVDQMMKAIRAVDSGSGVLVIAKNYTGDNLNFDMAMELLEEEGIKTAKVIPPEGVAWRGHCLCRKRPVPVRKKEEVLKRYGKRLKARRITCGLLVLPCPLVLFRRSENQVFHLVKKRWNWGPAFMGKPVSGG